MKKAAEWRLFCLATPSPRDYVERRAEAAGLAILDVGIEVAATQIERRIQGHNRNSAVVIAYLADASVFDYNKVDCDCLSG